MNADNPTDPSKQPLPTNAVSEAPAVPRTPGQAKVALALGVISLCGLFFPPFIGFGIAGLVLAWMARRRIAASPGQLKGAWIAYVALAVSAVGTLASLVLPGFVISVWIYAAFHDGQCGGC